MQIFEKIDDQELMRLCRDGNPEGFNELYRRYSKPVFNSILRLVTDFAQAEDLLQDVFVSLYQEIRQGKRIEQFGAFSRRVGINKAISFLRTKKYLMVADDYSENMGEDEPVDEEEFEAKVEEVKRIINALPTGFKMVVNLYLVEGIPQKEIADLLGISHETVRTQYHRAKKKIVSDLQKRNRVV